ncbi:MAG: hypothetical protein QM757_32210 [Paludibaculum sp.]
MNKEEFVQLMFKIGAGTIDSVVEKLEKPTGRQPYESAVRRSKWYVDLNDENKAMIREVIRVSVQVTMMSVLCEFDGVGEVAGDPEDGILEIRYKESGREILITDPEQEELHGLYRSMIEW